MGGTFRIAKKRCPDTKHEIFRGLPVSASKYFEIMDF
jgi:hypothetical protein